MMQRRMLILSCSIVILFVYFSYGASTKRPVTIDFPEQNIIASTVISEKRPRNDEEPVIFSKFAYLNQSRNRSENVIAYLVASYTGELRLAFNPYPRLREKILQLDDRLGDGNQTDVIIFHTGYPFKADILPIIESSRRQVQFVNIDHLFYKFSPGFDPHAKDPNWAQRGKWNYQHMCYFWFKQVFELKIIRQYRYMMRLDDDSQIMGNWPNVFDMMKKHQALYMANHRAVDYDYVLPGVLRIRNLTAAYIAKNNITVRNPAMFADVFNHTWEMPNFWNNIEIVDLSFMQRKDVVDFTRAEDESNGVFLYRWGDAPLRYVTLTLFVNETEILHRDKLGLGYCHPC